MATWGGVDNKIPGVGIVSIAYWEDASEPPAPITTGTATVAYRKLLSDGTVTSYDFGDNTFKAAGVVTATAAMTHVGDGLWTYSHDDLADFGIGDTIIEIVEHSAGGKLPPRMYVYGRAETDIRQVVGTPIGSVADFHAPQAAMEAATGNALTAIGMNAARVEKLDNLNATVSSRSTFAGGPVESVTNPVTLAAAQPHYAPSKAGDAMTLTPEERTSIVAVIEREGGWLDALADRASEARLSKLDLDIAHAGSAGLYKADVSGLLTNQDYFNSLPEFFSDLVITETGAVMPAFGSAEPAYTLEQITNAVWSGLQEGYDTPGTFGYLLDARVSSISGGSGGLTPAQEQLLADIFSVGIANLEIERADVRTEAMGDGRIKMVWVDETNQTVLMEKVAKQVDGSDLTAPTQILGGLERYMG